MLRRKNESTNYEKIRYKKGRVNEREQDESHRRMLPYVSEIRGTSGKSKGKTTEFCSFGANSVVFFCFSHKGHDIGHVAIKNFAEGIDGMR